MSKTFLAQSPLEITGELHHQIGRVLRSRPGDYFAAVCGDGCEYEVRIHRIEKNRTTAEVINIREIDNEPSARITLYQGNLKGKSMDEIIPPLVYLGISKLVPVKTARSEGQFDPSSDSKMKRVENIVQKATMLCHRTKLMEVSRQLDFKEALNECRGNSLNLIFWENVTPDPLREILQKYSSRFSIPSQDSLQDEKDKEASDKRISIGIFIGPEGGFNAEEIKQAESAGAISASLGKRILEARTAPIIAATAMLYELGDI